MKIHLTYQTNKTVFKIVNIDFFIQNQKQILIRYQFLSLFF